MNYKLADMTKIEVEAGHLRKIAELFDGRYTPAALDVRTTYPAAFEEAKEEWEDVTDRLCNVLGYHGCGDHVMKIENNRIWRRK